MVVGGQAVRITRWTTVFAPPPPPTAATRYSGRSLKPRPYRYRGHEFSLNRDFVSPFHFVSTSNHILFFSLFFLQLFFALDRALRLTAFRYRQLPTSTPRILVFNFFLLFGSIRSTPFCSIRSNFEENIDCVYRKKTRDIQRGRNNRKNLSS